MGSYSFQRVASLGRMISPLSPGLHPTLGALGRMSLHLSPLVSHSACLGPHEFTLVSPLSPTLGVLGRMSLHLSSICLPHLSLTLGALGRMSLHLSPTCLPHLSPTLGALGRIDKCKLMRPKAPRVRDKCGRQVWGTSGKDKCKLMRPGRQGGDKCKPMPPKEPRVGDKCGRQV